MPSSDKEQQEPRRACFCALRRAIDNDGDDGDDGNAGQWLLLLPTAWLLLPPQVSGLPLLPLLPVLLSLSSGQAWDHRPAWRGGMRHNGEGRGGGTTWARTWARTPSSLGGRHTLPIEQLHP